MIRNCFITGRPRSPNCYGSFGTGTLQKLKVFVRDQAFQEVVTRIFFIENMRTLLKQGSPERVSLITCRHGHATVISVKSMVPLMIVRLVISLLSPVSLTQ